jgi:hypothetical protein
MTDPNISDYPHPPEVRAWKIAHAMMWQRWQDAIDFPSFKKQQLSLPVEWRFDALIDAIGMLYGEYLTDHIKEYQELEAELLERFKQSS